MMNTPYNLFRSACVALLLLASALLVSCEKNGSIPTLPEETVAVRIDLGMVQQLTRSFSDTHTVNRILILPFNKTSEGLPNDDVNFIPAYKFASQIDVVQFPVSNAVIHLPARTTYQVLVIGYHSSDFDFKNQTNPLSTFRIGSTTNPTTLSNFYLNPVDATVVPEFFTCKCQAVIAGVPQGNTFVPTVSTSLAGTLTRLVSGFSVTVNNIPSFVQSVTLRAENLVKASRAFDASVILAQSSGDGANRTFGTRVPANGIVSFDQLLLPTFTSNKTRFFMDVKFAQYTQTYTITLPDSDVTSGNQFIFKPNEVINITGVYSSINIGFTLNYVINLDQDTWDGIQNPNNL